MERLCVLTVPAMPTVEAVYRTEPGTEAELTEEALRSVAELICLPLLQPSTVWSPAERAFDFEDDAMTAPERPGDRRGRRRKLPNIGSASDYQDVVEELGDPQEVYRASNSSRLAVWRLDSEGQTVLVGRMSTRDTKGGETGLSQIRTLMNYAEREGLRVGYVLLATNQPGSANLDQRLDISYIGHLMDADSAVVTDIVYRDDTRLARDTRRSIDLIERFMEMDVRLHFASAGGLVDWQEDRVVLSMKAVMSDAERESISRRTHGRIEEVYYETGRGNYNRQPFGFRRDQNRYLTVDDDMWPFVELIHMGYARHCQAGKGIRALRESLAEAGCDLSEEKIRTVLRDCVYVTGELTSDWKGETYTVRPIAIPNPIPEEVFNLNQRLLDYSKGKQVRTRNGDFLLQRVRILHSTCLMAAASEDQAPELQGRYLSDRPKYHHKPPVPSTCQRRTFDAPLIEAAAIRELLAMLDSRELQAQYLAASQGGYAIKERVSAPRIEEIDRQLKNLRSELARLKREYLDEAKNGVATTPEAEALGRAEVVLMREIRALRRQRELLEAVDQDRRELFGASRTLKEQLAEILTLEPPDSQEARQRRALVFSALVSTIVIHEWGDEVLIELFGPLVPAARPMDLASVASHAAEVASPDYKPPTEPWVTGRFVNEVSGNRLPAWRSACVATDLFHRAR